MFDKIDAQFVFAFALKMQETVKFPVALKAESELSEYEVPL